MLFSTLIFVFLFLPLVLLTYYIAPQKFRNLILLLASLFFYAWGEQEFVLLIIASTIIDFSAGIIIQKGYRKIGLWLSILFNISILIYFKYSAFFIENIMHLSSSVINAPLNLNKLATGILPLGISFYTFQTMSYTIDVYYKKIEPAKNIIDFGTYVTLFPQLIAGPIIKYKEISSQLTSRKENLTQFNEGIKRFIIGLAKKVLIANHVSILADGIFNLTNNSFSTPLAWIGAIAYTIQIYFDFSGYSDMAIGLAKMFGFNIPENFNYPYTSKSIQEFWRRWHISLSSWFKEYLYIPLGGNRKSGQRTYLNLFIVFIITGLWHGANWTFIFWGLAHGLLIITEKTFLSKWLSKSKTLAHIYTLLSIVFTWVIFRSNNLNNTFNYISNMLSFNFNLEYDILCYYTNTETIIALLAGIFFSTPIMKKVEIRNKYLKLFALISVFLLTISYISIGSYNPFIYFNF